MTGAPTPTGIEAMVCADIARRQAMGVRKYGTTLADNPADLRARLQHLYEELLDGANYVKWAMQQDVLPPCTQPCTPHAHPATPAALPVHLSLTVTAPSRAAAADALRDIAGRLADPGGLLPGPFYSHQLAGAVVEGELDQPPHPEPTP